MDKDPQEFIEGIQKIVEIMGLSPVEKVDLLDYQLKSVSWIWFD